MKKWNQIALLPCLFLVGLGLSACQNAVKPSEVKLGQCFQASDELLHAKQNPSTLSILDCTDPHNSEIIGVKTLDSDKYPGLEALSAIAMDYCPKAFQDYSGEKFSESNAELYPLLPSEASWNDSKKHQLACVALSLPERDTSLAKDASK